jgi:cytochrome c peroxidase
LEWAAEYFDPSAARMLNGAPVPEVERSGQVFPPAGLQVIESLLFPHYNSSQKNELLRYLRLSITVCSRYKIHFQQIDILDWQVFDAARLEVFRVMALGIAGFDDPLTLKSMEESSVALAGTRNALSIFSGDKMDDGLSKRFDRAISYLNDHPDFNSFDRMEFLTGFANPVTTGILELQKKMNIHVILYDRLLKQDAPTLFDSNAFNADAYAPGHSSYKTAEKIALGKVLFADPSLSGDGTRSCQSCHDPQKAFTDGLERNTVLGSKESLPRNTPTLINAALQPALFYDSRVRTLEDQASTVVKSVAEMHGSMALSVKGLREEEKYKPLFTAAFPGRNINSMDTFEIMNAIGSYVRSLVKLDSRFDQYIGGDKTSMNPEEIRGFNLFMGKAKCATCHYMPLFSGNFPPRFVKTETEVIGVPRSANAKEIDPDEGRFAIIRSPSLKFGFKVPTLRNASRTAPYMHNGVYKTLDEVLDFYDKGGGIGLGIKLGNQTLPSDSLKLSPDEKKAIIAFIKTLDSK